MMMRGRKNISKEEKLLNLEYSHIQREKQKYKLSTLPYYVGILFLLYLLALFGLVSHFHNQLPVPLTISDEALHPDRFIASRAQEDNRFLTDLGPRVLGSYENEVLTVEFLQKKITQIINEAHDSQHIELDVQLVSGSYVYTMKSSKQINIYANVQNVIVKLHGRNSTKSLLLNAHFDSVPTSPGGSDDGINCAAMLEVLRKYSKYETRPLHNVVFLFNGAEESGLQASHGFITKHRWAKECKVVINLEAAGAGGFIKMFQTGPNRPWLNEDYAKVPHPVGQTISEELFQAQRIPSDTDFRIFRDYGNLVGIDMAYTKDGYRYHTKYDGFDNIPLGSYQHAGDNVMSLVRSIANNPQLANDNPQTGNVIFFDIGGVFISYTSNTSYLLNWVLMLTSVLSFWLSFKRFNLKSSFATLLYFVQILVSILFGWILAMLFVIFLGYVLDSFGHSMSWYGSPWIILGLHVVPTIIISSSTLLFIKPMNLSQNTNSFIQAQMIRLIWTSVMLIIASLGIRSTYPLQVLVLFNTLAFILIHILHLEHSEWLWKIVYIIMAIVPTSYAMKIAIELFGFSIPLLGRVGSNGIPDIRIGIAVVMILLITLTPYYFLISVLKNPKKFYTVLLGTFLICFIMVFTPLGFPYSGNPNSPTPQRFWILHSLRVFYGEDGGIVNRDSGYFFLNMDRNSPKSVLKYVDELKYAKRLEEDCDKYLFCGMPLAQNKMATFIEYSTWVPASEPIISDPVNITVHSKTPVSTNSIRYNITVYGTDRSMFSISLKKGLKLVRTNVMDNIAEEYNIWNERPYYFFMYSCGKKLVPLNVILDIETPENHSGSTMDIAVIGNYVHLKQLKMTKDFMNFLSKFPDWADVTAWTANYKSWVI